MADIEHIIIPWINARRDRAADKVRLMIPVGVDGIHTEGVALVFDDMDDARRAVRQMAQALEDVEERRRWNDRAEAQAPPPPDTPKRRFRVVPGRGGPDAPT